MLRIRLRPSFRYVHEPLSADEDALPSLGNESIGAELRTRLLHSQGGAFLISGFRGVGKSTMVLRVLDQMVASPSSGDIVLPIWLSVARSTTIERLLFAVVRRIFEGLADSAVLGRLSPETRHSLLVAYMRTSLSFKETQSETKERSAGLAVGVGKGAVPIVDFVLPKLSMSAKRSNALATEAAFLAYSETDAEYDLMRIVSLVGKDALQPIAGWSQRRIFNWRRPIVPQPETARLRLVIILDEVDKLTEGSAGLELIEDLLSGIKNVLTMSGAHFLIVAGPDLHDRAVRDASRGNGIYESVFGWRMYVPCLWDAPARLIRDAVGSSFAEAMDDPRNREEIGLFIRYLQFKARGIPRRLLQEFNSFVFWEGNSPFLRLGNQDIRRIKFYAELESIMLDYFERFGSTRLLPVQIDEDRWRLAGYYVADWVLRSDGEPFSSSDLLREGDDSDFDPLLRISHRDVDRLLDHFASGGILEIVREFSPEGTMFGDISESEAKVYRLAENVRVELFGLAVQHETERRSQEMPFASTVPTTSAPSGSVSGESKAQEIDTAGQETQLRPPPIKILNDRYELSKLLGQGGMGSVFAGQDRVTGQPVAVKMLRASLTDNTQAMRRARREAELAMRLKHPQLVRTIDVIDGPDGSPALIMEFLDGPTLSRRILDRGPMLPEEAVRIAKLLTDGLGYLAGQGIARIDLKPSNIILQRDRGPVIIDLGVARDLEVSSELTGPMRLVGTPMYMAPELMSGHKPDPRADLYSLALVLYYCIIGHNPWEHLGDPYIIMAAVTSRQLDVSVLPVSQDLRRVIAHATELDPAKRYQTANELLIALSATPESQLSENLTLTKPDWPT